MASKHKRKYKSNALSLPLPDRTSHYLLLVIFSLFSIAASSGNSSYFKSVRSEVTELFLPVIEFVTYPVNVVSDFISDVSGLASMQAEIEHLRSENAKLRRWYQTALMLEQKNKSLSSLLNLKVDPKHSFITAKVVSDNTGPYIKSLLVAAGDNSGITENLAVISGEGLIGKVIEAGDSYSRVLLVTDLNSRVPVIVEGTSHEAILAGNNDDTPILKFLPLDAQPKIGAKVLTSGSGGVFPSGIPIGIIKKIEDKKLGVAIFSDMRNLRYVRIIDNSAMLSLLTR